MVLEHMPRPASAGVRDSVAIVNVSLSTALADVAHPEGFRPKPKTPVRGKRPPLCRTIVSECVMALRRAPVVENIRTLESLARTSEDISRQLVREGAVSELFRVMQIQPQLTSILGHCLRALAALSTTSEGDRAVCAGGGVRTVLAAADAIFSQSDDSPRGISASPERRSVLESSVRSAGVRERTAQSGTHRKAVSATDGSPRQFHAHASGDSSGSSGSGGSSAKGPRSRHAEGEGREDDSSARVAEHVRHGNGVRLQPILSTREDDVHGSNTTLASQGSSPASRGENGSGQEQKRDTSGAVRERRASISRRTRPSLSMADHALVHDSANGRRASVSLSALPARTNLGFATDCDSDAVGLFGVKLGTFERRVVPRRSSGSQSSLRGLAQIGSVAGGSGSSLFFGSNRSSVAEGPVSTTRVTEEPEDAEIVDVTERLLELFREQVRGSQRALQSESLVEAVGRMDVAELRRSLVYASGMFGRLGRLVALLESIGAEVSAESLTVPLTEAVRELLSVRYAALYVIDFERNELWTSCPPFVEGESPPAPAHPHYKRWLPITADVMGAVVRTGESVYLECPSRDPRFQMSEFGSNTTLCVPVKSPPSGDSPGGRLLGVLVAVALDQDVETPLCPDASVRTRFDPEDELLLRTLARESASVLQKALDLQVLLKAQQRVSVLLDTTRILSSEVELDGLIRVISQSAKTLLQADRCTIFLLDTNTSELWTNVYDFDGRVREIRIKTTIGIAGAVATTGRVVNIPDAYLDSRFNQDIDRRTGYRTKSMIAMPIVNIGGEIIGVIQMINKLSGSHFTNEDERLLNAFSSQAAVAIEKSKLFQKSAHMRQYLENILGSINSTVFTLSPSGHLVTLNRTDLLSRLGVSRAIMANGSYYSWLGDANRGLAEAIERVYKTGVAVQGTDFVLVGPQGSVAVNYSLAPLEGRLKRDGNVYWSRIRNCLRRLQGINKHVRSAKEARRQSLEADGSFALAADPDGAEILNFEQNFWATYRAQQQYHRTEQEFNGVVVVIDDISKEKKMMATLGRYMSPSLAQQVLEEGGQKLGGTRQKVTVMFGDVRGFTNMSESMDPRDLVDTLNGYFECAVEAINQNNGILDKYIGDAVMAVFGVPFVAADDAVRACRTALQMRRTVGRLNDRRSQRGEARLGFGIGINTGVVVNGNVGCLKRMEYTVIGDSVNLASRVEGLTKKYHVTILITEFTLADTGDLFVVREVDRVRVVGKKRPIAIYELLCERAADPSVAAEAEDADVQRALSVAPVYEKGLVAMRERRFGDAIALFSECSGAGDAVSEMMLERCQHLSEAGVGEDWDGVWNADGK